MSATVEFWADRARSFQSDLFLYGNAFVTLDGYRIDPAKVVAKIGVEAMNERIRVYRKALRTAERAGSILPGGSRTPAR